MAQKIQYAFFGTPHFAEIIIEHLAKAGIPPALIICNPDRPQGRKKIITPPPAKVIAEKYAIPVWQPETLNITECVSHLKEMDFALVAAYSKILKADVLSIPRLGTVGVHPSLLPAFRGATPIQSVLLEGESQTGVTLYQMDEKVDHGSILAQQALFEPIQSSTYEELLEKLAHLAGEMLQDVIPQFVNGEIVAQPQDESSATFTKKFTADDAFVNLEKDTPETVERKVRALNPEPGVWTLENGKRKKILEATLENEKLRITKVQIEGETPKSVSQ